MSKLAVLATLGASLFLSSCAGEYYVTDRPADLVYERPIAPYGGAIWIEGDWVWSGGRYVHSPGRWVRARRGRTYIAGSWYHGSRGYAWHRGHWR